MLGCVTRPRHAAFLSREDLATESRGWQGGETLREQVKNLTPPARLCIQSVGEDRAMANVLQTSSFAVSAVLFFIAGIGLAFTPCVFRWCRFCQPLSSAKARV